MESRRSHRVIGALLLLHFAVVVSLKLGALRGEEIWWLSHVTLAIAAVGFLTRSPVMLSSALINILFLHSLWIVDCTVGLLTGKFPVGVASYMHGVGPWTWLETLHHLYLLPLLLAVQWRRGSWQLRALGLSVIVFAMITTVSRMALSPESNVNYAFWTELGRSEPLITGLNSQPASLYLLGLNALVSGGIFFPSAVVLRRWAGGPADSGPKGSRPFRAVHTSGTRRVKPGSTTTRST